MVTLKDIAELTGVSISTVSRVMNNKGNISEEVKKKILGAAEELMFKRGVISQSLEKIHYRIGIIVPQTGEYYHNDPASSADLRSIQAAFAQNGHATALFLYEADAASEDRIVSQITEQQIEGVVVSDPQKNSGLIEKLAATGIPYIVTNGVFQENFNYQIDYNNHDGMKQLAEYLFSCGHRRILVLSGPETHIVTHNRLDGLQEAADEFSSSNASEAPSLEIVYGDFSLESGYRRAAAYIQNVKRRNEQATAILAFSDYIAMGAMRAVKEAGMQIPDDISVTGFDDIEMVQYTDPPLTTVKRYSFHFAQCIVSHLMDLITRGDEIESTIIFFRTYLQKRSSVASVKKYSQ